MLTAAFTFGGEFILYELAGLLRGNGHQRCSDLSLTPVIASSE